MCHLRWPFVATYMSKLSQVATYAAGHVYKFLYVLYPNKSEQKEMLFFRLGIFTMDFSCTPHTDQNNKNSRLEETVLTNLDLIQNCKYANAARKQEAISAS